MRSSNGVLFRWVVAVLVLGGLAVGVLSIHQVSATDAVALWGTSTDDEQNEDYDLSSLTILSRVLSYINNYYYEPARIDPHEMLCSALERMQRMLAELLVEYNADKSKVTITVNNKSKTFDISKVTRIFDIQYVLSGIMDFVQANMVSKEVKKKDIEYAAINGMLDTLDPHSSLLTPKAYGEFKLSTRGRFGGLGILIGIRDGKLTIITPYEGTPAWKVGLKAGDHIVEIDGQSTVNMSLDEAVKLMRGTPGTKCVLKILRKGWKKPRKFTIIRDIIKIRSVKSKLYPGGVGYIRIDAFQGNTSLDVRNHLAKLKRRAGKKFSGLILDLRDNPGGLLDEAIDVADIFLKDGVIVSTVGANRTDKDVNKASKSGTEPYDYPIVILVSPSSASASEIVSGALKNNNRAVVVGERTFGKGTVQMLYEFDDGSALKLTVAQYLTPGDISIQNLGIMPDIKLLPVQIEKGKEIIYYTAGEIEREQDLDKTLENVKKPQQVEQPTYTLKFLYNEKRDKEDPDLKGRYDYVQHDFYIQFAERLIKDARGLYERHAVLKKVGGLINKIASEEEAKIVKALAKLNIDWSKGEPVEGGKPQIKVTFGDKNSLTAGEKAEITIEAKNVGTAPLYRLHVITESDYHLFDKFELLVGKLDPGQSKTLSFPLEVPKDALNRVDVVTFKVEDGFGHTFPSFEQLVEIKELPSPKFAYSYVLDDSKGGNGDGRLQPGEEVELVLHVKNFGEGKALKGLVTLRTHELIPEVFISVGRVLFGELEPGEAKPVVCKFKLKERISPRSKRKIKDGILFDIRITDTELHEYISDQVRIPVVRRKWRTSKLKRQVCLLAANSTLSSGPMADAPVVAKTKQQTKLNALTKTDSWVLVELKKDLVAWTNGCKLKSGHVQVRARRNKKGKRADSSIEYQFFRRAPRIVLDLSGVEPYTTASAVKIRGHAIDDNYVRDLYILTNKTKAFFLANPAAPGTEAGKTLSFEATVPLEDGINRVVVVARETEKFSGSEIIIIYKKKEEAEQEGSGKK